MHVWITRVVVAVVTDVTEYLQRFILIAQTNVKLTA